MPARELSFARAWTAAAQLAPEREAIVTPTRRLTYGTFVDRARRLATFLAERGVGAGDKVAIELVNSPEYVETFLAAQLLGAVPVNVNYRYTGAELAYLLENSDAAVLVYHDEFADAVADACATMSDASPVLVGVGAQGGEPGDRVDGATSYPTVLATHDPIALERTPSGDDLVFLYTGGTTGAPKAVMWRSDDLYRSIWQSARPGTEPPEVERVIARDKAAATALPACPLMHGTGLFTALNTLSGAGKLVLLERTHLDVEGVWDSVERERVQLLTIVGDAFGRPLLDALDREPGRWDLGSLVAIMSSGVTWSPPVKEGILAHLPGTLLIDSLGASEGLMTRTETRAGETIAPARFEASDRLVVIDDDGVLVAPGDDRVGLLGVGGPIPLGYFKDEAKTAATFRVVDGRRFSVPGDYATVAADGTITLLGRGSACINTGGEKVYPEEVELVLRGHDAIADAVVVGVPDDRWGEMVVAMVQPATGTPAPDEQTLHDWCRAQLAGYKTPKAFVVRDSLERSPSGKADYQLLRAAAREALATRTETA